MTTAVGTGTPVVPAPPPAIFEPYMSPAERDAVMRDWAAQQLERYSPVVRTTGAMRARPCCCMEGSLSWFDYRGGEWRCIRCGHAPSADARARRRVARRRAARAALC